MDVSNRLFVPLNSKAFNWYKLGKEWEVRKMKGQYNLNNIKINRLVELRRGYNTHDKLWGRIDDVKIFNNHIELLDYIDFKLIFPTIISINEAEKMLDEFIIKDEKIIAFKISLINYGQYKKIYSK